MFQGIRRSGKAKARPHDVFQAGGQKAWIVRAFLCRHGLRIGADCTVKVLCVRRKGLLDSRCVGFVVSPGDGCKGFGVFPISRRILYIIEIVNIPPEVSRCHGGGPSWCVFVEVHLLVHRITMEPRHGRQETLERVHVIAEFFFQSMILNEEIVLIRHMDSSFIVCLR